MKTKYFTASEQAALRVFNNLNTLARKGMISVFGPCFTHYQKMFISRIVKDEKHDWLKKIAITFVEKHHLNFAVKVILETTHVDKKDKRSNWSPEKTVIGKLEFFWDYGDNWKVVEQESIFYSADPRKTKEYPRFTSKTHTSLKDFVSSI